jgi:hypothetical protein
VMTWHCVCYIRVGKADGRPAPLFFKRPKNRVNKPYFGPGVFFVGFLVRDVHEG